MRVCGEYVTVAINRALDVFFFFFFMEILTPQVLFRYTLQQHIQQIKTISVIFQRYIYRSNPFETRAQTSFFGYLPKDERLI